MAKPILPRDGSAVMRTAPELEGRGMGGRPYDHHFEHHEHHDKHHDQHHGQHHEQGFGYDYGKGHREGHGRGGKHNAGQAGYVHAMGMAGRDVAVAEPTEMSTSAYTNVPVVKRSEAPNTSSAKPSAAPHASSTTVTSSTSTSASPSTSSAMETASASSSAEAEASESAEPESEPTETAEAESSEPSGKASCDCTSACAGEDGRAALTMCLESCLEGCGGQKNAKQDPVDDLIAAVLSQRDVEPRHNNHHPAAAKHHPAPINHHAPAPKHHSPASEHMHSRCARECELHCRGAINPFEIEKCNNLCLARCAHDNDVTHGMKAHHNVPAHHRGPRSVDVRDPAGRKGKNEMPKAMASSSSEYDSCMSKCKSDCQTAEMGGLPISQCHDVSCEESCKGYKKDDFAMLAPEAPVPEPAPRAGHPTPFDAVDHVNAEPVHHNDAPKAAKAGGAEFEACVRDCSAHNCQSADIGMKISQCDSSCEESCAKYKSDESAVIH
ncbi:hypothetical protein AAE478_008751 [Parahypoxylon ruwenzoriense]